jgi:hypothetical protein
VRARAKENELVPHDSPEKTNLEMRKKLVFRSHEQITQRSSSSSSSGRPNEILN